MGWDAKDLFAGWIGNGLVKYVIGWLIDRQIEGVQGKRDRRCFIS